MIVLTGESHLAAIKHGGKKRPGIRYWPLGKGGSCATPFFTHDADAKTVTTHVEDWQNRTFSQDTLTIKERQAVVGVSMPFNTSRVLRAYSWHTHVPWQLHEDPKETPLSSGVVDALLELDYRYSVGFVEALVACGISVFAIEAPRIFETSQEDTGRWKDRFYQQARFDVIRDLDAHYRKTVRAKLGDIGVDVIAQPADTMTPNGSTKPEFSHDDPRDTHHANPTFGGIMFDKIVAYGEQTGALSRST